MAIIAGDVTRFPNGISTDESKGLLGDYTSPDPTKAHTYFEDFDRYAAAEWTVTEVGVATQALGNEDGGTLVITNAAADDDSSFSNKVGESFLFVAGKKLFFKSRFKVSDATQSELVMGIQITDTTPLDVTDGVFFTKADGSASMTLEVEKDNTATSTTAATLVDDTYVEAGFFYNGSDKIEVFIDGAIVGTSATTNLPDDEELTISFGITNGEAVAKIMTIDYIFVAKER